MRALQWDLSPRRPWEDAVCEMDTWTEAVMLRHAYAAGVEDAKSQADTDRWLAQDGAGQVG